MDVSPQMSIARTPDSIDFSALSALRKMMWKSGIPFAA
jgi:hypothetical protein